MTSSNSLAPSQAAALQEFSFLGLATLSSWLIRCAMLSCCARNLEPGEAALKENEARLLKQICESYYLPPWCSLDDYRTIFEAQGLQVAPLAG